MAIQNQCSQQHIERKNPVPEAPRTGFPKTQTKGPVELSGHFQASLQPDPLPAKEYKQFLGTKKEVTKNQ
jgi:hypothetical protein